MEVTWDIIELISKEVDVPYTITKNVVNLLDNDNTVPFIARYRKEKTGNMEPEKIRQVKEVLSEFRTVKQRIVSVKEMIKKQGKLNKVLNESLSEAVSLAEVEMLYAPYKPGSKRSLAERAREAGLEAPAEKILNNNIEIDLTSLIQPSSADYSTISDVKKGLQHIIADIIAKNTAAKENLNSICKKSYVTLESTKIKKAAPSTSKKEPKATKGKKNETSKKFIDENKFQHYFQFTCNIKTIKPHQILAINRGETNKILSVKIVIPENVKRLYTIFCSQKWIRPNATNPVRVLIEECISDAYDRLVAPQMSRQIRSDLTKNAEKASIDVFCSNLKNRLLVSTVKHKVVLALDPGFFHGCKLAVISKTGNVLYTDILYLNSSKPNSKVSEEEKLSGIISKYSCEIIAIGNGTACRETETKVAKLIKAKHFGGTKVCYCIVDECGASIYSVSPVAKEELPDMDHSLRGAVSIARRLQDPLAELVKIEPKHIGVGMYQHDLSDKKLKDALDCIVGECVSFVGVDLNTCSEHLLRRVSGLNATQAKNIIAWRNKEGKFNNREQLKLIKGLGAKTFDQCAGFIRIISGHQDTNEDSEEEPSSFPKAGSKRKANPREGTSKSKKVKLAVDSSVNPLDRTWIHPESYHIAKKFIKKTGTVCDDIGFPTFITKVKQFMKTTDIKKLAEELNAGEPTVKLIVDGLLQSINYDLRDGYEKPLFRTEITTLNDLKLGQTLTGRVSNVTHFGAFVDIGVGIDGLLHISKMRPEILVQKNRTQLELGDRIEVKIDSLELKSSRIGLSLS